MWHVDWAFLWKQNWENINQSVQMSSKEDQSLLGSSSETPHTNSICPKQADRLCAKHHLSASTSVSTGLHGNGLLSIVLALISVCIFNLRNSKNMKSLEVEHYRPPKLIIVNIVSNLFQPKNTADKSEDPFVYQFFESPPIFLSEATIVKDSGVKLLTYVYICNYE